jgi:ketosteroid isomerase-like protein
MSPDAGAQGALRNTQVVQQAYDLFKRGDIPALLNMMADDIRWTLPKMDGIGFSGDRQGRQAVEQFFTDLAADQTARQFDPREFIAQGDEVVALGHYVWEVKQTGRSWESDFAHAFTVRDGRVSRFREFMDTAAASAAFRPNG